MHNYPSVNESQTGFLLQGRPWPGRFFDAAMSFHAPEGLAAVRDGSGAYHIDLNGDAAYPQRFVEAFGFYSGIASVRDEKGFFHIGADGAALHSRRFRWAGNFQGDRCVVQDQRGFFHIGPDGSEAYPERYAYAGDFRQGLAVAYGPAGAFHIRADGSRLNGAAYVRAEPFHKGYAVVADERGAFHIDLAGRPASSKRFASAEPFYNGVALCRERKGGLVRLRENGAWTRIASELAPVSLEEIRARMADGARIGLLVRHAERHSIAKDDPTWGVGVLLSDRGRQQAFQLGRALNDAKRIALWSSPVERCAETCKAFAEGHSSASEEVRRHSFLGDGLHLDGSGDHEAPMRKDFGAFATSYLDTGLALGMRPVPEASERLLRFLHRRVSMADCTLFVTHDLFAAALMSYLGLKAPDADDWCNYLEGVCLISGANGVEHRRFLGQELTS